MAHGVEWKEDVNGWYIGVDTSIEDSCYMMSNYEGGSSLRVGFNMEDDDMMFIVGNENWDSIEEGKLYEIDVAFGNKGPWTGEAKGFKWDDGDSSLVLSIGFDEGRAKNFINEFQQMTSVTVSYNREEIANLSLRATFAAMNEVVACQNAMIESHSSNNSDPFSSSQKSDNDPFN